MRTSRPAYLMAMLAGLVIVGASTGGVVAATHRHDQTVAASGAATEAVAAPVSQPATSTPVAAGSTQIAVGSAPGTASPSSTPNAIAPTSTTSPAASARTTPPATSHTDASSTTAVAASSTAAPSPAAPSPAAPSPAAPSTSRSSSPPTTSVRAAATQKFKNGTYSATGSYNSPGGTEKLGVTITLAADKITKSDLDLLGGAGLSHSFQTAFAGGYSGQVIGKDISTVKLGAVSGSSLTGMGFNAALAQIETQAKAPG